LHKTSLPPRYSVKYITLPSSGERLVLVEGPPNGIAVEETTLYTTLKLRSAGLSPNTMFQKMSAVAVFLNWAQDQKIDVNQRIGSCDLFTVEETYSLKEALRLNSGRGQSRGSKYVGTTTFYNRCRDVAEYITWQCQRVIQRIPGKEQERHGQARRRLDDLQVFMLRDLPLPRSRAREGQAEAVQEIFLSAIKPGSPTNPFQASSQARNYALLLLYHENGLRRAEPLKLKGEHLYLHGPEPMAQIRASHDDKDDPRRREPRIKTLERDLPLSSEAVLALRNWMTVRAKLPGAKGSPYVFLARTGDPLSMSSVNDMFSLLRTVDGLPSDLTAHHSRHNANDRLTKLARDKGWEDAQERNIRNYIFGWTKNSDQGENYTKRATREGAAKAVLQMQEQTRRLGGKK
jgi:hypothetical protein